MSAFLSNFSRAATAAALLLLATAGCGDDDSLPPPAPAATLTEAVQAFDARDGERLCELLSTQAHVVIGNAAHGTPTLCARDVRRFYKWLRRPDGESAPPRIVEAKTVGNSGSAVVALPDGSRVQVPLVREGGRWKLDGLFDATLSRIQARGTPGENRLRAATVRRRLPGEPVVVKGDDVRLALATAFGSLRFARCEISFNLHLDERGGGAWVDDFAIAGGNPCFDAMACQDKREEKVPWRARLVERDGRAALAIRDACLDTCLGRFTGALSFDVTRRGSRWRLHADQATVGATGWRFSGALAGR